LHFRDAPYGCIPSRSDGMFEVTFGSFGLTNVSSVRQEHIEIPHVHHTSNMKFVPEEEFTWILALHHFRRVTPCCDNQRVDLLFYPALSQAAIRGFLINLEQ
jgi:hypothetical protein